MGFFKNLTKSLNPVKHVKEGFKDPWKSIKNNTARMLDPAGSLIREGRGQQAMPSKFKQTYDPAGALDGRPPAQPSSYQPGVRTYKLSPAAQQLYDDMRARMDARSAGQQYSPTITPQQQLADGGKVGKSGAREGCEHYESKAFERKSNGKIR